jgi:hypothetical protein
MDTRNSGTSVVVKKQEDGFDDSKGGEKRDVKPPVKPLNRVPRQFLHPHCYQFWFVNTLNSLPGACVRNQLIDYGSFYLDSTERMQETKNEM